MVVWIQNPFDNLPCEGHRKQRYWMMAEAFVRAGHRVVYWTSDFSHAKKARRDIRTEEKGIEVRQIPTLPYAKNVSIRRVRSHRAYAREWMRLAQGTDAPRPDLVVSSMPTVSAAGAALKIGRELGARVVIDVQDAWPETFERLAPKKLRWLARALLSPMRAKARRIYREADLVTGVCDRYRELTGRADYHRAYLGIESGTVRTPAARNATGRIRLVYSGNMGRTYDLKTLTEVVAANEDMELDVAGFGAEVYCPPDASGRIRFHGLLTAAELEDLFAQCEIGVIPMADESWVGLPNKVFDYAAAGLGIVSSLGGESAALLEKYQCGKRYRPGDGESLATAIRGAVALERGASRKMCEAEFDATRIYDAYVRRVT